MSNISEIQLAMSDIVIELHESGTISFDTLDAYYNIPTGETVYFGYERYREAPIIKQLMSFYTELVASNKMTVSAAVQAFNEIATKIYSHSKEIDTPRALYEKIFEFSLYRQVDRVKSITLLDEANRLADGTSNDVLRLQIKRTLLYMYLELPNKSIDQMKVVTAQLKELQSVPMTMTETNVKGLL